MIFDPVELPQSHAPQKTVEGDIDIRNIHGIVDFLDKANIIDHLNLPAVHVENRFSYQMLLHEYPAGLVDEWRIFPAGVRFYKNGVGIYSDDIFPRNKFIGLAPPMVYQ